MPLDKKNNKPVSIYFIVPAPLGISPGQRFRFEHYLSLLQQKGINFYISNFYTIAGWKTLYTAGNKFYKVLYVLAGLLKRFIDLFRAGQYTYVYLYREASPVGPAFFEWIITKGLKKKVIYDFDDAIWVPVTSEYNKGVSFFKNFGKIARICQWSYKISAGNYYLAQFAKQHNHKVLVIPTVVDTDSVHRKLQEQQTIKPCIGWTGSFSTLKYLDIVLPALQEIQEKYEVTFIVIADRDPMLPLKNYRFIKWSKETEVNDLLSFHIGLMPLYDDQISKGKCGFKAIQYMSLGIPALVSPVGVNTEILNNGFDGFICTDHHDWVTKMETLLTHVQLRQQMGIAARKKIEDNYSVKATSAAFLDLFK